jgi:hypothetical protein
MTASKYLILLLTVLFISCGNNLTDTKEKNAVYAGKLMDTITQVDNSKTVDTELRKTWSAFQQAVSTNDYSQFRQLSFDSLYCCDTTLSTSKFIKKCYSEIFDTSLLRKFAIPTDINQLDKAMEPDSFSKSVLDKADFKDGVITLKQFQVVKELTSDGAWTMTFDFIRTKQGYRFLGCDSYGGPICCR